MTIKLQQSDIGHINIALTGKMRSGKDTVARNLIRLMSEEYKVQTFAFGDSLKVYAKELFPDEFVNGRKPRDLFQWFGQTLRSRNEDVWINQLAKELNKYNTTYEALNKKVVNIITDLRQPNEYQFCKENGFYIIKVECDDAIRIKRMDGLNDNFDIKDLTHETERYIDTFDYDYLISTTHMSIEECEVRVKGLVRFINKKEKKRGK